jgi:hypothetical protein
MKNFMDKLNNDEFTVSVNISNKEGTIAFCNGKLLTAEKYGDAIELLFDNCGIVIPFYYSSVSAQIEGEDTTYCFDYDVYKIIVSFIK